MNAHNSIKAPATWKQKSTIANLSGFPITSITMIEADKRIKDLLSTNKAAALHPIPISPIMKKLSKDDLLFVIWQKVDSTTDPVSIMDIKNHFVESGHYVDVKTIHEMITSVAKDETSLLHQEFKQYVISQRLVSPHGRFPTWKKIFTGVSSGKNVTVTKTVISDPITETGNCLDGIVQDINTGITELVNSSSKKEKKLIAKNIIDVFKIGQAAVSQLQHNSDIREQMLELANQQLELHKKLLITNQ